MLPSRLPVGNDHTGVRSRSAIWVVTLFASCAWNDPLISHQKPQVAAIEGGIAQLNDGLVRRVTPSKQFSREWVPNLCGFYPPIFLFREFVGWVRAAASLCQRMCLVVPRCPLDQRCGVRQRGNHVAGARYFSHSIHGTLGTLRVQAESCVLFRVLFRDVYCKSTRARGAK